LACRLRCTNEISRALMLAFNYEKWWTGMLSSSAKLIRWFTKVTYRPDGK